MYLSFRAIDITESEGIRTEESSKCLSDTLRTLVCSRTQLEKLDAHRWAEARRVHILGLARLLIDSLLLGQQYYGYGVLVAYLLRAFPFLHSAR